MLSSLLLLVVLALICSATAFPLSALFAGSPFSDPRLSATQLLSLHDGTYLAIMDSAYSVTQLELNPGVQAVPISSEILDGTSTVTTIVARLSPANDSVMWAYTISYFDGSARAVVDDAGGIFVVGEAAGFIDFEYFSGFRLFRFSVDGEATWGEFYTDKALGLPRRTSFLSGANYRVPFAALAGPRTLAIVGVARADPSSLGRNAIFIDTITREARLVRFPLPNGPREFVETAGVAADSASGAACFADITRGDTLRGQISVKKRRLFVQCVNAGGKDEVVSRVLVPFEEKTEWEWPHVIMGGGSEGKAPVLYVVAMRYVSPPEPEDWVPVGEPAESNEVADVDKILLFKLDPTTLQDVEWESGLTSTKPTMRKLSFTDSSFFYSGSVISLRYIREQNTLVLLYESDTELYGIESLPDGTLAFRGNSSFEGVRGYRQWLLYFGNDPEPAAVPIPNDPRPNGGQDGYDKLLAQDFELSKDGRNLYLFGGLETIGAFRYGELITVPFPIPEFAQPDGGGPEMEAVIGDGLEDGVDESFEPSLDGSFEPSLDESFELGADETAEAFMEEELESSPTPVQEYYI